MFCSICMGVLNMPCTLRIKHIANRSNQRRNTTKNGTLRAYAIRPYNITFY